MRALLGSFIGCGKLMWLLAAGLIAVMAGAPVLAGVNFWTPEGPPSSPVDRLVRSASSSLLFAESGDRVYRSTDGGAQWLLLSSLQDQGVSHVQCDPGNPDVVYAFGGLGGLQRSTDRGDSWRLVADPTGTGTLHFGLDPGNPNALFVAGVHGGIARSTDSGASWTQALKATSVAWFLVDRNLPGRLIASVRLPEPGASLSWPRLLLSEDRGESWRELHLPAGDAGVEAIRVLTFPSAPARLVAGTLSEVFASTDGGRSWTQAPAGFPRALELAAQPGNTQALFAAAGSDGLWTTGDGGTTWARSAFPYPVYSLLFDPANPDRLMLASDRGVFQMRLLDETWTPSSEGLRGSRFRAIGLDPTNAARIYAAGPTGLFASADAGRSWKAIGEGVDALRNTSAIVVDPGNPAFIHVAAYRSILRSTDSGETWTTGNGVQFLPLQSIVVDPTDSNILYAGAGVVPEPHWNPPPIMPPPPTGAVYKSTDAGLIWAVAAPELSDVYVTSLAVDRADHSNVYAATWKGLFKSTDSGATWGVILPSATYQVLVDWSDSRTLFALGKDSLYVSRDAGESWSVSPSPVPGAQPENVVLAQRQDTLYAGTPDQGIMRSVDLGASWAPMNLGFRSVNYYSYPQVSQLAVQQDTRTIWAVTAWNGLHSFTEADSLFVPRLVYEPDKQWTGLALFNQGTETRTVTVTALGNQGQPIWRKELVLQAGQQEAALSQELGDSLAGTVGWLRVDGARDRVTGFFSALSPDLDIFDTASAESATSTRLVFPSLAAGENTKIWLANPNAGETQAQLELRRADGLLRTKTALRTLAAGAVFSGSVKEIFGESQVGPTDYVQVQSDLPLTGLAELEVSPHALSLLSGLRSEEGDILLVAPHFANGPDVRSLIEVVNLGSGPGSVRVRLINDSGEPMGRERDVALSPHGKVTIDGPGFFGVAEDATVSGYVEIRSAWTPILGAVRFGDPEGQKFASALPLVSREHRSVVFSHLVSTADHFTGLAIVNRGLQDALVSIRVLRADGTVLVEKQELLKAGQRDSRLLTEYFPELAGVSLVSGTIRLQSDQEIAAFALFGPYNLTSLSAIPAQPAVE